MPALDHFCELLDKMGEKVRQQTVEKNIAYGDAAGKSAELLEILYPDGIGVECFGDVLLMVRIFDKLTRLAQGDPTAYGEDPWLDMAGYALLGAAQRAAVTADA